MFAGKLQLMVPESVPLAPDVIESQLPPDVTAAIQGIVPVPVFETLNVVSGGAKMYQIGRVENVRQKLE